MPQEKKSSSDGSPNDTLRSIWNGIQDVASFGGTYRLRSSTEEYESESETYKQIDLALADVRAKIEHCIENAGLHVSEAHSKLRRAEKLIHPFGVSSRLDRNSKTSGTLAKNGTLLQLSTFNNQFASIANTAGSAVGGLAAATGLWGIVQVAGAASTGTAMAGLHGAAATSAGWAWFGGGSLATGGGGMALGHLVLPGVGVAVAIVLMTVSTHHQANEMEKAVIGLRSVNKENSLVLNHNTDAALMYAEAENFIAGKVASLGYALDRASKQLAPFGFLSKGWRYTRFLFGGHFYRPEEMKAVRALELAVEEFLSGFIRREKSSELSLNFQRDSVDTNPLNLRQVRRLLIVSLSSLALAACVLVVSIRMALRRSGVPPQSTTTVYVDRASGDTLSPASNGVPHLTRGLATTDIDVPKQVRTDTKIVAAPLPVSTLPNPSNAPHESNVIATQVVKEPDHLEISRDQNANGLAFLSMGYPDFSKARDSFRAAVAENPGNVEALNNLGYTESRLNNYREAKTILLQVLTLAPDRKSAQGNLGLVEAKLGHIESASGYFCEYLHHFPSRQEGIITLERIAPAADASTGRAVAEAISRCPE